MNLFNAARKICESFTYDPGHSDLDNEQPIAIHCTLGDWRRLNSALMLAGQRADQPEGGFSNRWRDTAVTVPCDGDDVIGYWSPDKNFGEMAVGLVHYGHKTWHAVGDPALVCGVPDYWMPLRRPQRQPEEDSPGMKAIRWADRGDGL
jgi:hypothetical protein